MLDAAAAVRPAVNCMATGLLSFWALQEKHQQTNMSAQQHRFVRSTDHVDLIDKRASWKGRMGYITCCLWGAAGSKAECQACRMLEANCCQVAARSYARWTSNCVRIGDAAERTNVISCSWEPLGQHGTPS